MNREAAKEIAEDTLRMLKDGVLARKINESANNSVTIMNDTDTDLNRVKFGNGINSIIDLPRKLKNRANRIVNTSPYIEVNDDSVLESISLYRTYYPCVLNFANATTPGGGFKTGSIAQEESIARSSGLYQAIVNSEYYDIHAAGIGDLFYTDTVIHSPSVPIFKNDAGEIVKTHYANFVTAAAPMKTAMLHIHKNIDAVQRLDLDQRLEVVISKRIERIVRVMAAFNHRTIILGAWGCGAFGNDPYVVARAFKKHLNSYPYFDNIIFSVYANEDNLTAFEETFDE